jgi:BolA family transcriptional regulator, general stress-responsive regulator
MQVRDRIEAALTEALSPQRLEIIDESHRHAGHAGARPEGETHFKVVLVADRFAGLSRLQRQRLVMDALSDLLRDRVHALSIVARTPQEAG